MNSENEKQTEPLARAYSQLHGRNVAVIAATTPLFTSAMLFLVTWTDPNFLPGEEALIGGICYGLLGAGALSFLLYKKRLAETLFWLWVPTVALFSLCFACGLAPFAPPTILVNLFATASMARVLLQDAHIPTGHCLKCGYDLRGNVSEICPECGETVHELCSPLATTAVDETTTPPRSPKRWYLALSAAVLAQGILLLGAAKWFDDNGAR